MKILIIGPFPLPIDGCSYANKVLFDNLRRRGVPVAKINTNSSIIGKEQGNTFSFKKASLFIKCYLKIYKILFCNVVYFTPGQTFYGVAKYAPFIYLCLLLRKPYVIHLHGNYLGVQYNSLSGIKKLFFKFLISHAAAAIVLTKSLIKNFNDLLPVDKISIAANFVAESLHNQNVIKWTDKLRILYLSNLMTEKGILEVLDALILLANKGIDFSAVIAGKLEAGIERAVFDRLALIKDQVNYVGVITGQEKIYRLLEANVFLLPTFYKMEGLPISILEAMAMGNVVITTAHAGIPDVVSSANGFLIQPRSSKAIAEVLEKVQQDIAGTVDRFSKINIQYSKENFSEKLYTEKIYSTICNCRH